MFQVGKGNYFRKVSGSSLSNEGQITPRLAWINYGRIKDVILKIEWFCRGTGHIGTNTPKCVPSRRGRPPSGPAQTGLCKFGCVWSALISPRVLTGGKKGSLQEGLSLKESPESVLD